MYTKFFSNKEDLSRALLATQIRPLDRQWLNQSELEWFETEGRISYSVPISIAVQIRPLDRQWLNQSEWEWFETEGRISYSVPISITPFGLPDH
ncbi:hypothetical protein AVEN_259816-1 [Araneus ventricosus]|uniref:Uncharacterized protein n=1 Tax=Araneus ventricosus TaxID=182803 RepID=A0A4Y2PWY8_ARAVE|nr:hypothetical protein AVEN_259816-1 [Araneus ventricosus]